MAPRLYTHGNDGHRLLDELALKRRPDYGSEAPMVVKKAAAAAMNEPAEAAMHNHRCPVHGQVMQAPKSFPVTCGNCGRVCVPDTEPV